MKINKTLETTEGRLEFSGELSEAEANLVVEVGLATLLSQGALPFLTDNPASLSPEVGNA